MPEGFGTKAVNCNDLLDGAPFGLTAPTLTSSSRPHRHASLSKPGAPSSAPRQKPRESLFEQKMPHYPHPSQPHAGLPPSNLAAVLSLLAVFLRPAGPTQRLSLVETPIPWGLSPSTTRASGAPARHFPPTTHRRRHSRSCEAFLVMLRTSCQLKHFVENRARSPFCNYNLSSTRAPVERNHSRIDASVRVLKLIHLT